MTMLRKRPPTPPRRHTPPYFAGPALGEDEDAPTRPGNQPIDWSPEFAFSSLRGLFQLMVQGKLTNDQAAIDVQARHILGPAIDVLENALKAKAVKERLGS